jgi:membrane-associated protease RseP (regulator of RpoE activity)
MLPLGNIASFAFHPAALASAFGGLAEPVLVGLAGSWIALLFHEMGHALAALLVGVRIWGIRLGVGPTIWRGRLGHCRIHLALLPFLGAVQLLDEDACAIGYRDIIAGSWRFEWGPDAWRAPIISAAGGLSNLAGLVALVMWWDLLGQPAVGTTMGDLFLVATVSNFAGYLNLIPCFRSDGIHLLAHIRAARFRLQPSQA